MSEFQINASEYKEKMNQMRASEELKDYLFDVADMTNSQDDKRAYRRIRLTNRAVATACLVLLGILFFGGTVYAVTQKKLLGRFFYVVDEQVDMDEILIQKNVVYDVGNHIFTLEGVAYNELTRAGCLTIFVQSKDGSEPISFQNISCHNIIMDDASEYHPDESYCWKIQRKTNGNQFSLSDCDYNISRHGIKVDGDVLYYALYPFANSLQQFIKEDGGVRFYLDFQTDDLAYIGKYKENLKKYDVEDNSLAIYDLLGSDFRFSFFTEEEWTSLTEKTNHCSSVREFFEIWEDAGFVPTECNPIVTQVFSDERMEVLVGRTNVRVCFNVDNPARRSIKNICVIKTDGTRISIFENGKPAQSKNEVANNTYSKDQGGIISFVYHLGEVLPNREKVRIEVDGIIMKE